jgi:hypothetical protein
LATKVDEAPFQAEVKRIFDVRKPSNSMREEGREEGREHGEMAGHVQRLIPGFIKNDCLSQETFNCLREIAEKYGHNLQKDFMHNVSNRMPATGSLPKDKSFDGLYTF